MTAKFVSQNSWLMRYATGAKRCRTTIGCSSLSRQHALCNGRSPPDRCAARQRAALMAWCGARARTGDVCRYALFRLRAGYFQQYLSRDRRAKQRDRHPTGAGENAAFAAGGHYAGCQRAGESSSAVAPATCVAWRDERQWLWAMRHQWDAALPQKPKTWLSWRRCWGLVRMTSRCLITDVTVGNPGTLPCPATGLRR